MKTARDNHEPLYVNPHCHRCQSALDGWECYREFAGTHLEPECFEPIEHPRYDPVGDPVRLWKLAGAVFVLTLLICWAAMWITAWLCGQT